MSRITPSSPPNPMITNGRGEEAGATPKSRSACDETDRRESEGETERVGREEAGERKKEKEERKSCRVFVEKSLNETRRRRWLVGAGGGKHAED